MRWIMPNRKEGQLIKEKSSYTQRESNKKMEKCHSHHVQVSKNGSMKVTIRIECHEAEAYYGMAKVYTEDGCIADFIKQVVNNFIQDDLERDLEKRQKSPQEQDH